MKTTHRDYAESLGDFGRLAQFVIASNPAVRTYSTWCLGRLVDWRYSVWAHKWPIERFCEANAHLWFDGFGELAGFAVSENGDADFAILTAAGYRFLFEGMLGWALNAWAARGPRFTMEVTAAQELEIAALERAGFQRRSTFYTQAFDLTQPLPARYPLEEGFSIVDMAAHPDYRAQRVMRADGFEDRTLSESEMAQVLAWQQIYHAGPTYHAATDLCVAAPDGTFVSGCEALIDARNVEADVERVCTHRAYRRRGLARAVIQECLYRLQGLGMRRAYITGYSPAAIALYRSLGAGSESASYGYERVLF